MRQLYLFLFLFVTSFSVSGQTPNVKLVSWNIRDFGQSKDSAEIAVMAQVLRGYDVIAIQEVVAGKGGAQAVARLADALDRTGDDYDYRVSNPTRSKSNHVSERYAFLWRTANISLSGRPKLLSAYAKRVEREPYLARFEWENKTFRVAQLHARPHDQQPEQEVAALRELPDEYGGEPLLLMGDFNLVSRHTVFNPWLARGYTLAVADQKTTLRRKHQNGTDDYSRECDNILVPAHQVQHLEGGVLDVLAYLRGDLDAANRLSDHVPVYTVFDDFPQLGN